MELQYCALGFSHKKTPIELREKLAFSQDTDKLAFLQKLQQIEGIKEVVLLATCNRVEIYFYTDRATQTQQLILQALAEYKNVDSQSLQDYANFYSHIEAIHHIFCVACSLDSVAIGETQIVGQLKDAYRFCLEHAFCGKALTRLIHFALKCAAKVRNQTQISNNAISVASIAVNQAKLLQKQYHFAKKALVVGFGEMGSLSAKHLLSDDYEILICNRNQEKIQEFIAQYDKKEKIKSCRFQELPLYLNAYPLVFSATRAEQNVISQSMIAPVDFKRFWFDLAIPRDIEVFYDENIQVFVIDDLKQIAQDNLNLRKESLHKAYEIVGVATMEFSQWLQTLGVEPLIKKIRELAKNAALKEVQKAIKKGYIPKEYQYNVEKTLHQAFNVFLHNPTQHLREQANTQESDIIIEAIKGFFGIDEESLFINAYKCEYDMQTK